MELLVTLLSIAIVALIIANTYLLNRATVAKRQQEQLKRAVSIERTATASLIRLASEEIGAGTNEAPFLKRYCDFARRTVGATGLAGFTLDGDHFRGVSVSGIFPPLESVPEQVRNQLLANPEHHSRRLAQLELPISKPELQRLVDSQTAQLYEGSYPQLFPAGATTGLSSVILAPVTARKRVLGMVIAVQDTDAPPFTQDSAEYLLRLGEIAGMCIDGMRTSLERMEQERKLRQAHEEGMLQVTTGMVHNIGNAVTVAQLIIARLLTARDPEHDSIILFLVNDLLPTLKKHQEAGDLADFLAHEPEGQHYLEGLIALLPLLAQEAATAHEQLLGLDQKLQHITEIIDLQQHFVGELGTEDLLDLATPIRNAVTIAQESAEQRNVTIDMELAETPRVLADRTMMTQVILNLITNALEATARSADADRIHIRTYVEKGDDAEYVVCDIADNGPGIAADQLETVFDPGVSSKLAEANTSGKGLGLHFCRQTLHKYHGTIALTSTLGKGTTVHIRIPA